MRQLIVELTGSALFHVMLLVALCGVLYFPYLGSIPFFDKGEPREALAVQDIVQRGEWLVPLKRGTDIPSKPPLFHWSAALVTQVTGKLNEATVRFPSALYATLGVLLIYWLGRKIFDDKTALLGAAILATMLVYQDQALSARVDMTLCFYVTLDIVLFYALYRGHLTHPLWVYVFFIVVGLGTLAKGPLGLVLPGLVAGSFALLERRWDLIRKFCFHPGAVIALVLPSGWYIVAVTRDGEGFFNRQILEENLSRFVGGSGHNHPFYYYVPYLLSRTTLPWGMFLPLGLWDAFKSGIRTSDDRNLLKLWVLVMFVFFSISVGKRPVYLLPLCPALSLLLASWFYKPDLAGAGRLMIYRGIAIFAAFLGALLLVVTLGALWNQDYGWLFGLIETLLKPIDRANLIAVKNQIDNFGGIFTSISLMLALLWFSLGRFLWFGRICPGAYHLVPISILYGMFGSLVIMPVIAQGKSYRSFMREVNQRVKADDKLYVFGGFNSDAIVFYRGGTVERLEQPLEKVAAKTGKGDAYMIMPERSLKDIQARMTRNLPLPLLVSEGKGLEGTVPLVLVQVDLP